jgi:hypothetical protein
MSDYVRVNLDSWVFFKPSDHDRAVYEWHYRSRRANIPMFVVDDGVAVMRLREFMTVYGTFAAMTGVDILAGDIEIEGVREKRVKVKPAKAPAAVTENTTP